MSDRPSVQLFLDSAVVLGTLKCTLPSSAHEIVERRIEKNVVCEDVGRMIQKEKDGAFVGEC